LQFRVREVRSSLFPPTRDRVSFSIGSPTASFTISVLGPSTVIANTITLSCSGGATCSFSSPSISAGGSSQVTVSGLSSTSANPLNFSVVGTSGSQTSSVALTVFFADLLAVGNTLRHHRNGREQCHLYDYCYPHEWIQPIRALSCPPAYPGIPPGTECYWNPPAVDAVRDRNNRHPAL
jgi:hypothetical protein